MIFVLKIPLKTKRLEYVVLHAQSGKFSNQCFLHGHRCGACDEYRAGLLNKREGKSEGLRILASLPKLPFQSSPGY